MENIEKLTLTASQVRRDIVRMVNMASSGHPGGSLGIADVLTALFCNVMKHDPKTWRPDGEGQDMFILSAGHLSPVYYSLLSRCGYFPKEELASFRKYGSRLQGHPSVEWKVPGVHISTGSLGQGLSVACGAALAKKLKGEKNLVYVLVGDGESQEGQIWEAAAFGAHHKADNLIAITDHNGQQIDGPVISVMNQRNLKAKWEAFGWECFEADGHNFGEILSVFEKAKLSAENGKPKMIIMNTIMGKGVDFMSGTHLWHGKAPNNEQTEKALSQIEETLGDF